MARKLSRKQLKYFGTKRQKAAAKRSGKKVRKAVAGTPKRKKAKKSSTKRKASRSGSSNSSTSTKAATITISKTRRKNRIGSPMKNVMKSILPAGAALAGGYASGMIEEKINADDPKNGSLMTAGIGLALVLVNPSGAIGAAGLGMIGGAGRGYKDNSDAEDGTGAGGGEGGAAVRGIGKGRAARIKQFRAAMRERMNPAGKGRVITGMPDDRSVITGPGRAGANYNGLRNRF